MGKLELIHKIQLRLAVWKGKILNSRKKRLNMLNYVLYAVTHYYLSLYI